MMLTYSTYSIGSCLVRRQDEQVATFEGLTLKTMFGLLLVFQLSILSSSGSEPNTITVISMPANPTALAGPKQLLQAATTNSSDYLSNGLAPHKINPVTAQVITSNSMGSLISHKNDSQTGEILAGKLASTTATPSPAANQDDNALSISTMEEITSIGTHIINSEYSNNLQEVGSSQDLFKSRYSIVDTEVNDLFPKIQSLGIKSRRSTNGDWWTKLKGKNLSPNQPQQIKTLDTQPIDSGASKQRPKQTLRPIKVKVSGKNYVLEPKHIVYQEQPLSQNTLLTIRYQLAAIRNQHKALVTKSMPQLQQLDNKLIDYYKLCMKKKMPLYAGMLYRTRDFTNRMAKEVKHEQQVLEAMTKQVQNVLRQKLNNLTLVREYNQLVVSQPSTTVVGGLSIRLVPIKESNIGNGKRSAASSPIPIDVPQPQKTTNATELFRQIQESDKLVTTKRPKQRYTVSVNEVNLKKELTRIQTLIDRINGSCYELNLVVDDINYLFKLKQQESTSRKGLPLSGKTNKSYQHEESTPASSGGMMVYDPKRRKMVKSPVKVFLEKYGKLTMDPSPDMSPAASIATTVATKLSTLPTTLQPDMKPLFESSSMSYIDTVDQDLGFDETVGDIGQ